MSLLGVGGFDIQLVVFYLLLVVVTNVVSQDTSSGQLNMGVFVPKVTFMMPGVVCQGSEKRLSCSNNSMVLIINKADYGRTYPGKTICPYNSTLEKNDKDDKKVDCKKDVKLKVRKLCHKRKTCQLSATEKMFGRPCRGIYKYLQIVYACGLPVFVPKNVTVTKPNMTEFNVTQSNTTVPTTTPTSNRTKPLNTSCTTSYASTQPVTSPVPFVPSSTVVKTVNDDKQRSSTSTVIFLNYSTTIMGLQSSAPFRLSTAGKLLIWFLHFRGKNVNAPAQTNISDWLNSRMKKTNITITIQTISTAV